MVVTNVSVCESPANLQAFVQRTLAINREASDIVNTPVVLEGYALSGKTNTTVFTNIYAMAFSRVKKYFMLADPHDPVFNRCIAEIKKIAAECVKRKYECRVRRVKYDHLKDCDMKTKQWFMSNIDNLHKEVLQLKQREERYGC